MGVWKVPKDSIFDEELYIADKKFDLRRWSTIYEAFEARDVAKRVGVDLGRTAVVQ